MDWYCDILEGIASFENDISEKFLKDTEKKI